MSELWKEEKESPWNENQPAGDRSLWCVCTNVTLMWGMVFCLDRLGLAKDFGVDFNMGV